MDNLTEIFCLIDDFCREFEPAFEQQLLTDGQKKHRRACALSLSELMTCRRRELIPTRYFYLA